MKKLIVAICISLFLPAEALNAHAALVEWNLAGQLGNQVSNPASVSAPNVSGIALTRGAGLTPTATADSMNSINWTNQSTDYYEFGLTVASGYEADITGLNIGTRSSATGPGTIGLYVSTDNYTNLLYTFNQAPGSNFVDSAVPLSLNDLTGTILFHLVQIGTTAANGGATSSVGTFRVTNYFLGTTDTGSFNITGSIEPVPIPGAVWLLGSGLLGLVGWRRFRKS